MNRLETPEHLCYVIIRTFVWAESVAINHGVAIVELGHDKDHIHLLRKAEPTNSRTQFMGSIKSA